MFRVMKFGRYVTVDDGGNYVVFHKLNVHIKIKCRILRAKRLHNNSSQRELRPLVLHIVLRLKQVNFKVRLHDLKNSLVNFITKSMHMLIGQSAMVYCAGKLMEKLCIF